MNYSNHELDLDYEDETEEHPIDDVADEVDEKQAQEVVVRILDDQSLDDVNIR